MALFVGLTGGIATGKSSVLNMLQDRGAATISADDIVHELLDGEPEVARQIRERMGEQFVGADGGVDKQGLAAAVFNDVSQRKLLEGILHPLVRKKIDEWRRGWTAEPGKVCVAEIPLLFEAGYGDEFDLNVVVYSELDQQLLRLTNRHLTREEANSRLSAQMPLAEKCRRADIVLPNTGSLEDLESAVDTLWRQLVDAARTEKAQGAEPDMAEETGRDL